MAPDGPEHQTNLVRSINSVNPTAAELAILSKLQLTTIEIVVVENFLINLRSR